MIIAVDYDGVIADATGQYIDGAIDTLRYAAAMGHDLILWTCKAPDALPTILTDLQALGVDFTAVNECTPDSPYKSSPKVWANIYLDDHSFPPFSGWGKFKDFLDQLENGGNMPTTDYTAHAALKRERFTSRMTFAAVKKPGQPMPTLVGTAITYGTLSDDRGGYLCRFMAGSAHAVATGPVLALANHDYTTVLGSTANGTLRLTMDANGVNVEIDLPDTSYARDLVTIIDHLQADDKSTMGMSFGMLPGGEYTEAMENGQMIRNYSSFQFDEVSTTVIPAFTSTTVDAMKSSESSEEEDEDEELAAKAKAQPLESRIAAAWRGAETALSAFDAKQQATPPATPLRNILSVELEEARAALLNT